MRGQRTEPDDELNRLTERVVGLAIDVHRTLGPGLLEATYEAALCIELDEAGISYRRQAPYSVRYRGRLIGEFRPDLIVDDRLIVEVKSTERPSPLFEAQVLAYLKVTGLTLGLLINFNSALLKDGVRRLIWSGP